MQRPAPHHLFDPLPYSSHTGLIVTFQTNQTHFCLKALEPVLPSARTMFLPDILTTRSHASKVTFSMKLCLATIFRTALTLEFPVPFSVALIIWKHPASCSFHTC